MDVLQSGFGLHFPWQPRRIVMSSQISCPECGHKFSLKSIKPGKYKPACTACKKKFGLVAHAEEPVRLEVSKLPDMGKTQPVVAGLPKQIRKPLPTATVGDAQLRKPPTPPKPEATGPAAAALDATLDSEFAHNSKPPALEATFESISAHGSKPPASKTRIGSPDGHSNPATDNTMDVGPSQTQKSVGPGAGGDGEPLPSRMGGYRILSELGRGGMGAVYLANQVSLDRNVALKTIRGGWTASPRAVARFIREAYAAAQLTHHNVVQIYDLGEERGTNFFSMELVNGGSLQDLLKKETRLVPQVAATMIAQAARGLKFAHEHGMVHRDIKPANLMLTSDGIVKVADLGLVKTPTQIDDLPMEAGDINPALSTARGNVTDVGTTMGTPAYMSPEQSVDATKVDHRADIYSLGCTFYALLTGHGPFKANSAKEVMKMHQTLPMPLAHAEVPVVPEVLDKIIFRMTAKSPDKRYQNIGEVVTDIEKFLSTEEKKLMLAKEQNIGRLNAVLKAFNAAPLLPLRKLAPLLLGTIALVLLVGMIVIGQYRVASAVAFAIVVFPVSFSIISGCFQGASPIGKRARTLVLESRWSEWAMWAIGLLLTIAIVVALGLSLYWIGALILAVGLAFGLYFGVTQAIETQRKPALEQAHRLLRSFRASGIDETSIRNFVSEFSGKDWEEFFESLFDYDTMRAARTALVVSGKAAGRRRFAGWRDVVVDRLDEKIHQRKAEKDRGILARVEHAGLRAEGMSDQEARQKSFANAASMVDAAWQIRESARTPTGDPTKDAASAKRDRIKAMLLDARSGPKPDPKTFGQRAKEAAMDHLFGGKFRFVLAAGLIAACVFWAKQNGFLDAAKLEEMRAQAEAIGQTVQEGGVQSLLSVQFGPFADNTKPLNFPILGGLFNSLAPILVGLVVLISAFATGWRYSLAVLPGILLALLGPLLGVPTFGIAQGAHWLSSLAGCVVIVIGGLVIHKIEHKND